MYRVLYRKWRPKTFDDVIGQPQVTRALASQIKENRLSHAYLFTGSRGTGKTSCAKIFSKAVNCLHPIDGNPCNECEICRGIDNGTILDISEIDAASNRGIDDIRVLRDEANFTPSMAKYRIFIIDEVHMLTIEAFNALLKTLEEPPEHVKFILATTEVQKLPSTILSRCQRYDFRRIEPEIIADRITEIAESEGAKLDYDAAMLIARIADGAMRDALSLLDRCISVSDTVSVNEASAAAGLMGREYLFKICRAIKDCDTAQCLLMLGELHNASCDTERLCTELISVYRDLLIAKTVEAPENLIIATAQELNEIKELSAQHSREQLLRALSVLADTVEAIKKTQNRRIEAELAFIRLCSPCADAENTALVMRISALEEKISLLEKSGVRINSEPVQSELVNTQAVQNTPSPSVADTNTANNLQNGTTDADEGNSDFELPWNDLPEDIVAESEDYEIPDEPYVEKAEPPMEYSEPISPTEVPFYDVFGATDYEQPKTSSPPEPQRIQVAAPATPAAPAPVQRGATVTEVGDGTLENRLWQKIAIEAERTCKPLIGMLTNSTARIQGNVIYINSPNAAFKSLMQMPMFAVSVEKAALFVLGKQYGAKAE